MTLGASYAATKFGLVCAITSPPFKERSNPWCQFTPRPAARYPDSIVITTESPSGLLKLSWIAPVPASLPRTPGQHCPAAVVDGSHPTPPIVPSTKVDWARNAG